MTIWNPRVLSAVAAALLSQAIPGPRGTHTENGLAGFAKILCSGVFVSGRAPEDVVAGSAYFFMPDAERDQVKWTIDRSARLARASFGSTTRASSRKSIRCCARVRIGRGGGSTP